MSELDSVVIEAGTRTEAEKNILVDVVLFPIAIGLKQINIELIKWFVEYCIENHEQNIL